MTDATAKYLAEVLENINRTLIELTKAVKEEDNQAKRFSSVGFLPSGERIETPEDGRKRFNR